MTPTINLGQYKKRDRTINKQAAQAIYNTPRWKRLRAWKVQNNPLCEDCEHEGRVTITEEVHHILDIDSRPDMAFDYDNLISLCIEHHKKRHQK